MPINLRWMPYILQMEYHWDDLCGTMIYSNKDLKALEEQAAEKIKELEKTDPAAAEAEKDRIWKAIQDISRGL